jgi:hypothetical protein
MDCGLRATLTPDHGHWIGRVGEQRCMGMKNSREPKGGDRELRQRHTSALTSSSSNNPWQSAEEQEAHGSQQRSRKTGALAEGQGA